MNVVLQVAEKIAKDSKAFKVRDDLGLMMSSDKINQWEMDRAKATFSALRRFGINIERGIENCGNREKILKTLYDAQVKLIEISNAKSLWSWQNMLTNYVSVYGVSKSNPDKPHHSFVSVFGPNCQAEKFFFWVNNLLRSNRPEDQAYFLFSCPDHYLKQYDAATGRMEVSEVTGGSRFINHYHIVFDDTTGVFIPPDVLFPYQIVGTAYLADGTRIGGVRYQFRNLDAKDTAYEGETGACEACIYAEFPEYTPKWIFVEHQMHLACEWSQLFRIYFALQQH